MIVLTFIAGNMPIDLLGCMMDELLLPVIMNFDTTIVRAQLELRTMAP